MSGYRAERGWGKHGICHCLGWLLETRISVQGRVRGGRGGGWALRLACDFRQSSTESGLSLIPRGLWSTCYTSELVLTGDPSVAGRGPALGL